MLIFSFPIPLAEVSAYKTLMKQFLEEEPRHFSITTLKLSCKRRNHSQVQTVTTQMNVRVK